MSTTSIEWATVVWNAIVGCSIISPGCINCYAMRMAARLKGVALSKIAGGRDPGRLRHYIGVIDDGRWNGTIAFVPEALCDPLRWRRPQNVFVNSMSDMFHESLDVACIRQMCAVMAKADWHVFQVLTKRAERMRELLSGPLREFAELAHVWWGVSVENKKHALPRIDVLRQTPAKVRFLSVEPLLEDIGEIDLAAIDWVIVGGESGSRCRPMQEPWVQSVLRQCEQQGVEFFFKQWGGRNKKAAGRLLNGQVYDGMPKPVRKPVAAAEQITAWIEELQLMKRTA